MTRVTIRNIVEVKVEELSDALAFYFDADVPVPMARPDWEKARVQMAYYGNTYSTLCGFFAVLNVAVRRVKKGTDQYNDLAAKRDLVTEAKDAIGRKYDTISRMFTVYQEEKERTQ